MVPISRAAVKPGETLDLGTIQVEGTGPSTKEPLYNGKPLSAWIKALQDKDPNVRQEAAEALGRMGPDARAAVPALRDAMEDKQISEVAAVALWNVDRATFIDVLKTQRGSQSGWAAVVALWQIGPAAKEVIPILLEIAKNERDSDRPHALAALGSVGADPEVALPLLTAALRDPTGNYAPIMAAQTLGTYGAKAKAALPDLEKAMQGHWDAKVRVDAAGAIWRISQQAKTVVPVLTAALKENDGAARQRAIGNLRRIGPAAKEAVPALLAVWQDPKDDQRDYAAKALKAIDPEAAAQAGIR
jgi:HEAT repeat protein